MISDLGVKPPSSNKDRCVQMRRHNHTVPQTTPPIDPTISADTLADVAWSSLTRNNPLICGSKAIGGRKSCSWSGHNPWLFLCLLTKLRNRITNSTSPRFFRRIRSIPAGVLEGSSGSTGLKRATSVDLGCLEGRKVEESRISKKESGLNIWQWVKNRYAKWNPGKWKHGL